MVSRSLDKPAGLLYQDDTSEGPRRREAFVNSEDALPDGRSQQPVFTDRIPRVDCRGRIEASRESRSQPNIERGEPTNGQAGCLRNAVPSLG